MNAMPIFDALSDRPDKAAEVAESLVDACQLQHDALAKLHITMYPVELTERTRAASRRIFAGWYAWIEEADGLVLRVLDLKKMGYANPELLRKARDLDHDLGFAQLRVRFGLDEFCKARESVGQPGFITQEEARREIQDRKERERGLAAA